LSGGVKYQSRGLPALIALSALRAMPRSPRKIRQKLSVLEKASGDEGIHLTNAARLARTT